MVAPKENFALTFVRNGTDNEPTTGFIVIIFDDF